MLLRGRFAVAVVAVGGTPRETLSAYVCKSPRYEAPVFAVSSYISIQLRGHWGPSPTAATARPRNAVNCENRPLSRPRSTASLIVFVKEYVGALKPVVPQVERMVDSGRDQHSGEILANPVDARQYPLQWPSWRPIPGAGPPHSRRHTGLKQVFRLHQIHALQPCITAGNLSGASVASARKG